MDLCGLKLLKYEVHCDFLPLCEQVPKQALKTVCYSIRDTRWTTVIYKCSLKLWGRQVFCEELIFPRRCPYHLLTYFLSKRRHTILQILIEKCKIPYHVDAADAVPGSSGFHLTKKYWLSLFQLVALKIYMYVCSDRPPAKLHVHMECELCA